MKYRITENICQAIDTLERANSQLKKKANALEQTGDMANAIEAFGVIKNIFNNVHLDNWASSFQKDINDEQEKNYDLNPEITFFK